MNAHVRLAVAGILLVGCAEPEQMASEDGRSSRNCASFGLVSNAPTLGSWLAKLPQPGHVDGSMALPHRLDLADRYDGLELADIAVSWLVERTPSGVHINRACVELTNVCLSESVWADLDATDGPDAAWIWLSVNTKRTGVTRNWALEVSPGLTAKLHPGAKRP